MNKSEGGNFKYKGTEGRGQRNALLSLWYYWRFVWCMFQLLWPRSLLYQCTVLGRLQPHLPYVLYQKIKENNSLFPKA